MLWAGGAATVTSSSSSSPLKETWKNATVSSADRGIVMFDEVGDDKYVEDDDDTIYVECSTTLSYRAVTTSSFKPGRVPWSRGR
jgi:hypothetical protein